MQTLGRRSLQACSGNSKGAVYLAQGTGKEDWEETMAGAAGPLLSLPSTDRCLLSPALHNPVAFVFTSLLCFKSHSGQL